MKWSTVSGLREAEAVTFAQRNLPSYTAMCRAGSAVARHAEKLAALTGIPRFVVLCGPGNNGGDGFVAARCLKADGYDVSVCMTVVPARLKGDAARAWKDMSAMGIEAHVLSSSESWSETPWSDPSVTPRRAILIDALLGIGAHGQPTGTVASAIHWINEVSKECPVLAVDVPSGLDADRGIAPGEAVKADLTVTFSRPKIGFCNPGASAYLGNLKVADIGLPNDLLAAEDVEGPDHIELLALPEMQQLLRPERRLDSHKRTYGHALVIGGCDRYPHAPVLSGLAAYRAGCGLVTLDVPPASRAAAAYWVPEAIFPSVPLAQRSDFSDFDAIAIGPGMGAFTPEDFDLLRTLVGDANQPRTVVDADGLNALAELTAQGWKPNASELRLVLTPHPGEAARLLQMTTAEIQSYRPAAARSLAERYHAVVVLKGHNTLVAEPGGRVRMCMGGNPGMSTAGTGDLLTGIIVGLLARGLGTEDAVCLGVYHHALAGDDAAFKHGQESLIATDLFETLRF